MAYDPVKAHKYYMEYKKKGLKKGRKKGKTKTKKTRQESLVAVSTSGLNDAGRIEASFIKDRLKKEMNAKLAGVTDPEKRNAIKREYSQKAQAEMNALKSKSEYAKQKATKTTSAKSSGSKVSGSSSKSSGSTKEKAQSSTKTSSSGTKASQLAQQQVKLNQQISNRLAEITKNLPNMTEQEKADLKEQLTGAIERLRKLLGGKA